MPRPLKPVALQQGRMSNESKRIRQEQEDRFLKGATNQLKAPTFLDPMAKKEFKRVVELLKQLDVVQNLDLTVLAIYCDAYSNYVKLSKQVQEHGSVEFYTNTQGFENKVVSSYVQAKSKYIEIIFKCSGKLGLSVSDRLKLIVPKEDEDKDELLRVLKG